MRASEGRVTGRLRLRGEISKTTDASGAHHTHSSGNWRNDGGTGAGTKRAASAGESETTQSDSGDVASGEGEESLRWMKGALCGSGEMSIMSKPGDEESTYGVAALSTSMGGVMTRPLPAISPPIMTQPERRREGPASTYQWRHAD